MRAESPFIDCTDLIGDRDRLLEHGHHNGYFYFPGLLPAKPVLELRQQVLQVAEQHALLEPDTDPDAAIRRKAVFSSANRMDPKPSDVSTLMSRNSDFSTRFRITSTSCVFWRYYSAPLFSLTPVTSAMLSFQENISIPRLHIRTSTRFAVRGIHGPCGHRWETVTPS